MTIAYAWRRRSLTTEHSATITITLARRTDGCDVCAGLGRPRTTTGLPCVYCGAPTSDLLLVVGSTHDRRRLFSLDGEELPAALDFEEVPAGDPAITAEALTSIEEKLQWDTRDGWELERLWSGHPHPLPERLWGKP